MQAQHFIAFEKSVSREILSHKLSLAEMFPHREMRRQRTKSSEVHLGSLRDVV
jgi:hypothetical protein